MGRPWHGAREPGWNEPYEPVGPAWKGRLVDADICLEWLRTLRRRGGTESVGSFPFPTRAEARLAQEGVEGLQWSFPGNPDLGSRAWSGPDQRKYERQHTRIWQELQAKLMRLQLLLWFPRELFLATELSNDGLFIVILLRACAQRKRCSWRTSLDGPSPSSNKALKGLGVSEMSRPLEGTKPGRERSVFAGVRH